LKLQLVVFLGTELGETDDGVLSFGLGFDGGSDGGGALVCGGVD